MKSSLKIGKNKLNMTNDKKYETKLHTYVNIGPHGKGRKIRLQKNRLNYGKIKRNFNGIKMAFLLYFIK